MQTKTNKTRLLPLLVALGLTATSQSFAHTEVQKAIDVPATGSGDIYNNLTILHGCRDLGGTNVLPVIAHSVIIPTLNPVIKDGAGNLVTNLEIKDLLQTSSSATTHTDGHNHDGHTTSPEGLTTLAGLLQLVQSKDIFSKQNEKTDAQGNVIGFEGTKGNLGFTLHGQVPFLTKAVFFKPSACIKTLKVKLAAAEICKPAFTSTGPKAGTANLWFTNKTAKFSTPVYGPLTNHSPTLTFNNTAEADASCTNGNDKEYVIWPSDEDVNTNMPIKKYWDTKK